MDGVGGLSDRTIHMLNERSALQLRETQLPVRDELDRVRASCIRGEETWPILEGTYVYE